MVDIKKIDALTKTAIKNCCDRLERAKSAVKNNKKRNGKNGSATLSGLKSKYL